MSIKLHIWKAKHTGGTKFYHVLRFVGPNASFSIRHYASVAQWVRLGAIANGAVELDEELSGSPFAGVSKINDKRAGGYSAEMQTSEETFATTEVALEWIRQNFNAKAGAIARRCLSKSEWTNIGASSGLEQTTVEIDEPDTSPKPELWGTW